MGAPGELTKALNITFCFSLLPLFLFAKHAFPYFIPSGLSSRNTNSCFLSHSLHINTLWRQPERILNFRFWKLASLECIPSVPWGNYSKSLSIGVFLPMFSQLYSMVSTVISPSHTLAVNPHISPMRWELSSSAFYWWGNWGPKRLRNWPSVHSSWEPATLTSGCLLLTLLHSLSKCKLEIKMIWGEFNSVPQCLFSSSFKLSKQWFYDLSWFGLDSEVWFEVWWRTHLIFFRAVHGFKNEGGKRMGNSKGGRKYSGSLELLTSDEIHWCFIYLSPGLLSYFLIDIQENALFYFVILSYEFNTWRTLLPPLQHQHPKNPPKLPCCLTLPPT